MRLRPPKFDGRLYEFELPSGYGLGQVVAEGPHRNDPLYVAVFGARSSSPWQSAEATRAAGQSRVILDGLVGSTAALDGVWRFLDETVERVIEPRIYRYPRLDDDGFEVVDCYEQPIDDARIATESLPDYEVAYPHVFVSAAMEYFETGSISERWEPFNTPQV